MSLDKRSVRSEANTDVVVRIADTAGVNTLTIKAEDAAHVSGDTGVMPLAVRNDGGTALAGTDGDYIPLSTDNVGNLRIAGTVTATNPSVQVDDAVFTPSTSSITMAGYEFDDATPDSVNEGDGGAARMSANRNVYTTLRDAAGNERGANITAGNELNVIATAQPGVDIGDVTINNASIAVTATDLDIRDITKATDSIQVSANTTANSLTNPIFVNVTESAGSAAKATFAETAALAAQASATLSGATLTASKTGTFNKATISSEVPFKAVIQSFDEAAATVTMATIYGEAGSTEVFEPANRGSTLFQVASDASPTAKFQIVVTNNNGTGVGSSGVVHATIEWDEVT